MMLYLLLAFVIIFIGAFAVLAMRAFFLLAMNTLFGSWPQNIGRVTTMHADDDSTYGAEEGFSVHRQSKDVW